MAAIDRANLVAIRTLRSACSLEKAGPLVCQDRWFEALAGRAVGHGVHCSQGLEGPMWGTGKIATLRLDEVAAGGITNSGKADNWLTERGTFNRGLQFRSARHGEAVLSFGPKTHSRRLCLG